MELMISSLKARVSELEDENRKYRQALDKASSLASRISAACQPLQPE
jgi:prefoldin subunit 5